MASLEKSAPRMTRSAGPISTLFFFLLLAILPVDGAFTHSTQWKLDAIEKTFAGTCYRPGACVGPLRPCVNATLKALLDLHTNNEHGPGLSIAYYDLADGSMLGGAAWANWNAVALPIGVCFSGQVDGLDNAYATTCRFAIADDDHDSPSAHAEECAIDRPQLRAADGCYTPPRQTRFRLDDTANAILAILGLLIALPGILFGAWRWSCVYRAKQQEVLEGGHALPLIGIRDGAVVDGGGQDMSHVEPAHA